MQTYSLGYLPKLQTYQHELLQRLERIVSIDSGTGQIEGVNLIISLLERWMDEIGFSVILHPSIRQ